jgi:Na+-driven multidrug efflux pump
MLQALVVRVAMNCMLTPSDTCLTALGHSRYSMIQRVCSALWVFSMVPVGFYFFGVRGLIWAMALSELPTAFVLLPPLKRFGVLRLHRELMGIPLFAAGYLIGSLIKPLLTRLL